MLAEHARGEGKKSWRDAFLHRHNRSSSEDAREDFGDDFSEHRTREPRTRSLSRPRPPAGATVVGDGDAGSGFNQRAVLDQDRLLIEKLTQRQPLRERPAVKKPPPPPKVRPYRRDQSGPPSPASASAPTMGLIASTEAAAVSSGIDVAQCATPRELPQSLGLPANAQSPSSAVEVPRTNGARTLAAAAEGLLAPAPVVEPIVPRVGGLFTATDIDSIMNQLDGSNPTAAEGVVEATAAASVAQAPGQFTQNFGDISKEFYQNNRIEVPSKPDAMTNEEHKSSSSRSPAKPATSEFQVPERRALKEQINAIDSWLEDDFSAREQLHSRQLADTAPCSLLGSRLPMASVASKPTDSAVLDGADGAGGLGEADIFRKLEGAKQRKALGERVSPVFLKEVAAQAKPLLPGMGLEKLVEALRLFTSARHEDHDLYLRILGEIPMQVRGITPEALTTCVRVLWRLRLHEETYLELFSMEAMNMIRAKRRPVARAPRRAPAPGRAVDGAATASAGGCVPTPPPPAATEAPAPFSAVQLIQLGNSLSQLGAKHPPRFMDIFQEQLTLAIPRLTAEECELVSPTFAMSQLMPDPLRRIFLERCAKVDAGKAIDGPACGQTLGAAPDIAQYQHDASLRRRREKNFRNIYIIEASIRKETFSFFSSLPADVRAYFDRVHADAASLQHEGTSALTAQIAAVLDQLGVQCDTKRLAGPLGLHIVAKATNQNSEWVEIVYECSDATSFYAVRQDDKGAAPQYTATTKLRHRLLQRLGVQLTHIDIWEWQQMSEAQRVNYMVKIQSLI